MSFQHHDLGSASSGYTTYALLELPALATGTTTTYSCFSNSTANPRAFRTTYALPRLPALATIPTRFRYYQLWLHYLHASGTSSSGYTSYILLRLPALVVVSTRLS
ncbi:hypothetical protein L211DRAFT_589899 [Terfezia boudieri ATCC MYA-4762]|uniref:Uncharacterized protein n=1 Tax=Terfezia boudieri ATCC MYA-4762 TaxID=1051890 RepID=A0A3N4LE80_9PEZI|nr:hypothetical protein L211DRAFT_589899 [Terfezia boudieri ATCC MYA-4762]